MAINFPDSPSNGDQYVVAGNTYTWNGVSWDAGSVGSSGGGGSLDPIGTIVAWSGTSSNIPSDYQLCDGGLAQTTELEAITGANVPDLRDKFIVGASDSTGDTSYPGLSPGATGGSADATLVSHSHTINSHTHSFSGSGSDTVSISVSGTTGNQSQNHTHVFGANTFGGQSGSSAQLMDNPQSNGGGTKQGTTSGVSQDHTHSFSASGSGTASISISGTTSSQSDSGTDTQGSSATNANLPPYYSLCDIVKHTVATINSGSSTFTGLTDTPSSLGAAGQVAAVNSGGTALEFIDVSSSATTSVKDFGAVGNGVADDTTAIQNAIDSGAKHLTFLPGTYKITGTISVDDELHVFAKGAKFVQTTNSTMFNFNVTSSANVYSLSSSYLIGSDTISLTSAPSTLKAGDAIKITSKAVDRCQRDNGSTSSLYRVGEWAIVKSVSGQTITLTMPLKEVKGVSPTSVSGSEESIVNSYDTTYEPKVIVLPRTSMSWVGGELAFEEGHDTAPYWSTPVFKCSGYTNPKFSEIVITRGYQIGISLTGTVHAIIKDCSISNLTNNTSQSQYGYGVATAGTFKTLVDGCTFANTRHGFTTSSRSYQWDSNTTTSEYLGGGRDQSGMVVNCHGDGNNDNSVFDTHMCAQDYVFNNCVVDGAESGFAIRGRNVTVSNCKTFNVNRGILAHTEYANSATDSDAWANDKNHMTSVRINDCEFNAYNYPMHMKALTSCDITDVVANAGQAIALFVEGCKVNLHGTNTFAVSNFHGTRDVTAVNDKGMITVTGSTSLASYIDPGIFVSPGSYLRLDGTLATSDSNDLSIFHFNSGYSHSIVNDGKISIKLSTAIRYIRNAVDNCTFSGQGELMWESTNKHSSFATNFIGTSTDTTKWAYIDAYEIGDAIRHYWKDKRPKTFFSNVTEKLTHTGTGSKVDNAIILPSQHMRWANQLTGGEVIKQRFNIDQPDNNTSTFEINFCNGYVHDWTSSAGRQEVEITAIMPAYRTQTIYMRIIEGDQAAGDTNVYAIVKDKTIAGGFNSSAQEAGAITLDVTAPSGTVITVAPIETTVSRLSINVP